MAGAAIAIDNATTADTILSVKQRVFALNRKLHVRRQRLVYSAGPRGMDALADDETLGGAGVAQDGSAKLDVLLADLTAAETNALGEQVWRIVPLIAEVSCCELIPTPKIPCLLASFVQSAQCTRIRPIFVSIAF